MKTNIPERIAALREAMKEKNIDAYIIPSSDPHLSEYPADRWKSREWISGFDGSAGTVVVTADKAGYGQTLGISCRPVSNWKVQVSNYIKWLCRKLRQSRSSCFMNWKADKPSEPTDRHTA